MRVTISFLIFVLLSFRMVAQAEKKGSIQASPQIFWIPSLRSE
jgi:hypothetical protein